MLRAKLEEGKSSKIPRALPPDSSFVPGLCLSLPSVSLSCLCHWSRFLKLVELLGRNLESMWHIPSTQNVSSANNFRILFLFSKVVTLQMKEAPGFDHNSVSLPQGAYKGMKTDLG